MEKIATTKSTKPDKGTPIGYKMGKYYKDTEPIINSNIIYLQNIDYYYIFTENRWIAAKYKEKPKSLKLILEGIDDSYMIKDEIKKQLKVLEENINIELM